MKILNQLLLVIFSLILLSSNCKKDNQTPVSELSKLPAITQIGANTFGCLVNGTAFIPGGPVFSGSHMQCNYIYTAGGYYLTVGADNKDKNDLISQIIVRTNSLAITEGQTLTFNTFTVGNANASYALIASNGNLNDYETNNAISGQLTITKFDQTNQIVSGTFFFNAINNSGDVVKITDGRFDMLYTR